MPSEVVQLCRDMVAIPSVNPQDRTASSAPFGEERMAAYVTDWLHGQGLIVRREMVRKGRENIISLVEGTDRSKTLLLCAHTDTVGVDNMSIDPFDPAIRDGRLYGRGSCDTKASLACMMMVFRDRVREGNLPYNLCLLASCGEENDMCGTRQFARDYGDTLAGAVFGEPTQLHLVTAHKGDVRFEVSVHGRSAHSSTPQLGRNAIYDMSRVIAACEKFASKLTEQEGHPLLGTETLAITQVRGGRQINVIPDLSQALLDWRILPGRNEPDCRAELLTFIEQGVSASVSLESIGCFAGMETNPEQAFCRAWKRAVAGQMCSAPCRGVAFATDASSFADLAFPKVVFGPGHIAQAHTPDEWIAVEQIDQALAIYRTYLAGDWGV